MKDFTISQLARETNVSIETIRYYERMKLINPPRRSNNGYRHYNDHDINQLHFIRNTQILGFSLKEIKQFLLIKPNDKNFCSTVKTISQNKLENIQQKISQLQNIEAKLKNYIKSCQNNPHQQQCPMFDALWPGKREKSDKTAIFYK